MSTVIITSFNKFILNEKLSIHDDLMIISNKVLDSISNSISKGIYLITDVETKKVKIKKIYISINTNFKNAGSLDTYNSKLEDDGMTIYLRLNNIRKDII